MFIDTHTHLYLKNFDEDRDEMMQRAIDSDVRKFYLPNIDSSSIQNMIDLESQFPKQCFAMMGLHPCSVKENYKEELLMVKKWLEQRDFCAIGEIGIDLYWDTTFLEEQKDAFRTQIRWAKELKRPIVIHARNSMDEILKIVEEENNENLKGIFHCYSGNLAQSEKILNFEGFLLGIGGVVTFKNSGKELRNIIEHIDLEHLVLETDAPYLSPSPYRGKRNESSYIPLIATKIAEIKGVEVQKVANITTNNAEKLFMPFV